MAVIGLEATYLSVSGKGMSRHQYNLIKGLSRNDQQNYYYVFVNKRNSLPPLPRPENFCYVSLSFPMRIIWDQFQVPSILKKFKLDIYHSWIETLPVFAKANFVLTVTEVPDYRRELSNRIGRDSVYGRASRQYIKLFFRRSLKKARAIIVNSKSTKTDLIEKYNLDEKNIHVVYLAAQESFCEERDTGKITAIKNKFNVRDGYILHISSFDPRDNTPTVIRAYQKALSQLNFPQRLIIAGNFNPEKMGFSRLISELNLMDRVVFTGRIFEQDLVSLYQAADLYVDPSLYEGFGLQVVEAMACGIPVITSNVTSLPEIAGGAGILVSPTDIEALANALVQVLTKPGLRQSMSQKSLERAGFFSWDKAAQETLDIYKKTLA